MKQNTQAKLFILGLAVLGVFLVNCGKSAQMPGDKVVEEFIDLVNKRIPGTRFDVKPGNWLVKPVENNRYKITLKKLTLTSDFSMIIKFFYKDYSPSNKNALPLPDTARIEELVAIYSPDEEYTGPLSMKGFSLDIDYSKFEQKSAVNLGDLKVNKIRMTLGNITFGDLNINNFPQPGKRPPHLFNTDVEDIKLELSGITKKKENLSVLLEVEKISHIDEGSQVASPMTYVFIKDALPPDLSRILQEGSSISDLNLEFGKAKIFIKKNGTKWGGGTLDSVSVSSFLRPDETGNAFKYGIGFGIKDLELSIPGKKEIELLSNIKELRFDFSIEHLNPEAVLAVLDYMKKSIALRDMAGDPKGQKVVMQGMTLLAALLKSEPLVKLSIAPFKHYFGEMEIKFAGKLYGLLSPPDSKISIILFKIDETIKKIKEANVFSPPQLQEISESLAKYAVKRENGDASIIIEQKRDQPGKYFLNGRPR